ncbi:DegT/DnrJ/EryC1/StrS family aminotransferase [Colwellia sp. D2M02]|uniref:DegT/DnrJ/EryC1/StrS family aminotransferase n=1 Tax=Colwellia sp. D2M02 TaxID=2841562 RepID=UPI001C0A0C5E|nr:DegT/DnrJ/EryC1/StrS family aminotransferase [Colwellia sp. D2M02]MBU2892944.1 DegT/DnrJ/EryC1/StrS family aminotransferase [Colwellia sp. D2M02]
MSLAALTTTITEQLGRQYGMLTSSGSAALITALKASGVPSGSEVIMPDICCPAVFFAIQFAGYTPVLSDISLDDFCMNSAQVEPLINEHTSAIIAIHSYGHYCQISDLHTLAKQHSLVLIEDACLAMGGTYQGKPLGSYGDISIVSFGYDKIINCNYGGALVTNNKFFFDNATTLLNTNQLLQFAPQPSDLAQLTTQLTQKLARLAVSVKKRQDNMQYCYERLAHQHLNLLPLHCDLLYWRLPLLVEKNRDELISKASEQGIIITRHYKPLSHLATGIVNPNAEYFNEHIINIFIRPETPKKQLDDIIGFINEFYR